MKQQNSDEPKADSDPKTFFQDENKISPSAPNLTVVRRHNLLPIRSNLRAISQARKGKSPSSILDETSRSIRHPQKKMNELDRDRHSKVFRKLAANAASLTDAEIEQLLLDAGLGDGILSAKRNNESGLKRMQTPTINLTIRLTSDFATLKQMGCSEDTLSALRNIDPPQQEAEVVAEKVETGDMTMLSAPPEAKMEQSPSRRFQVDRRQLSSAEPAQDANLPIASADLFNSSMLRRQPVRRAGSGGSPLPSHLDWNLEAEASPMKFVSMSSPVPRFEEAPSVPPLDGTKPAITDLVNTLQRSSYSYRSVFTGPPRFPDAKRDVVTPPQQQASNQNHDRRSCTAQHKQQREPNLILESRISAALEKEAQAPTTTERMGLRSVQDRAAALEVDQIGNFYGAKDHERIRNKQDRLMEVF
jgi:hypothetical protein